MNLNNYFAILSVVLICVSTITNSQNRITGGSNWDIKNSPYVVSIHIDGHYRCVGTIITLKKVLTTDSCLKGFNPPQITIKAGVTDYRRALTVRTAKRIIRPTDIHPDLVDMDLAVIFFEKRIGETRTVKTVSLCDTDLNPGLKLRVIGWGSKIANIEQYCPELQAAEFEVVPSDECEYRYAASYAAARKNFPSTLICLTDRSLASHACSGDAGAPAVYNGKLCAVVADVRECLNPNFPTLYTSIRNDIVRYFIERAKIYNKN